MSAQKISKNPMEGIIVEFGLVIIVFPVIVLFRNKHPLTNDAKAKIAAVCFFGFIFILTNWSLNFCWFLKCLALLGFLKVSLTRPPKIPFGNFKN